MHLLTYLYCIYAGTISISLSSCSIPGKPCNFVIGNDVVEFGLGKHYHKCTYFDPIFNTKSFLTLIL